MVDIDAFCVRCASVCGASTVARFAPDVAACGDAGGSARGVASKRDANDVGSLGLSDATGAATRDLAVDCCGRGLVEAILWFVRFL